MNRLINRSEIESVVILIIKNILANESPGPDVFTETFYQTYKEELMPFIKFFQKTEEEKTLLKSFYQANITLIPKPEKDTTKKENYKQIPLMNTDTKFVNKTLANRMHQYIKKILHYD